MAEVYKCYKRKTKYFKPHNPTILYKQNKHDMQYVFFLLQNHDSSGVCLGINMLHLKKTFSKRKNIFL